MELAPRERKSYTLYVLPAHRSNSPSLLSAGHWSGAWLQKGGKRRPSFQSQTCQKAGQGAHTSENIWHCSGNDGNHTCTYVPEFCSEPWALLTYPWQPRICPLKFCREPVAQFSNHDLEICPEERVWGHIYAHSDQRTSTCMCSHTYTHVFADTNAATHACGGRHIVVKESPLGTSRGKYTHTKTYHIKNILHTYKHNKSQTYYTHTQT